MIPKTISKLTDLQPSCVRSPWLARLLTSITELSTQLSAKLSEKQDQKLRSYDIALQAAQSKSRLKKIENLDRLIFDKFAN